MMQPEQLAWMALGIWGGGIIIAVRAVLALVKSLKAHDAYDHQSTWAPRFGARWVAATMVLGAGTALHPGFSWLFVVLVVLFGFISLLPARLITETLVTRPGPTS